METHEYANSDPEASGPNLRLALLWRCNPGDVVGCLLQGHKLRKKVRCCNPGCNRYLAKAAFYSIAREYSLENFVGLRS